MWFVTVLRFLKHFETVSNSVETLPSPHDFRTSAGGAGLPLPTKLETWRKEELLSAAEVGKENLWKISGGYV